MTDGGGQDEAGGFNPDDVYLNKSDSSERAEASLQIDTGLACLVMLVKFLGQVAEPEQLRHQAGKGSVPFSVTEILRAAKELGIKARSVQAVWDKLPSIPLPAIAVAKDGSFFILGKVAADKTLIQSPLTPTHKS